MRSLIAIAFAQRLPLKLVDVENVERKSLFVPPVLDARIEQLASTQAWSYSETFAALCAAALLELMKTRGEIVDAQLGVVVPFAARPGQDVYYRSIMASINRCRICLAEASTGIGKSRSMIAAAITIAERAKTPVVVAAPTLAILGNSLWDEYETLHELGMGRSCKVRFFPGASEFVDSDGLIEYFRDAELIGAQIDVPVKDWLRAGCPVRNETALTRALQKSGFPLRCLMSDLREIATLIDPLQFVFKRSDHGNESTNALLALLRTDAVDADIIFCTHAMLAMGKLSSWLWFPRPSVVMVDEAHQFEGIVAGVTSDRVSLHAFRHSLQVFRLANNLSAGSPAGKLETSFKELISAANAFEVSALRVPLNRSIAGDSGFLSVLKHAAALSKHKSLGKLPLIDEVRNCLSMTLEAIESTNAQNNIFGCLEFSPERRFPALLSGKRSVSSMLAGIWSDASGGVVLASASLSTPDEFGNTKFDYIAGLLALPLSRLDTPNPVIAPWLTSLAVLHLPTQPEIISRPSSDSRNDILDAEWLGHLGEQVACVAELSIGGTLVLMTSYAQIVELGNILTAIGIADRLVSLRRDERFVECEGRFRAAHKAGLRPVMLALGVAWTGVDLTDKEVSESEDNLLSDLIIGCLPVGLNRSSTMAARIDATRMNPIIKESLMTLLQGMGRCVRSAKAKNKHIWIMDGRLWTPWRGMATLQKSARRVMDRYQNQDAF